MEKKILIIVVVMMSFSSSVYAQQEPQYTQYMYNTSIINPAYVGSKGVASVYGLYRAQWIGLEGAPKTANLTYSQPLSGTKLGFGLSIVNDNIGPSTENQFSGDISYTLFFQDNARLAFGIKATANFLSIDYSLLNQYNPGEAILQNNVNNRFSPNLGAGFYYYNNDSYFGLSVPMFLDTKKYNNQSVAEVSQRANWYLTAGKVFDVIPDLKVKPAAVIKAVNGAPLQADLSANFMYGERFVAGMAYRWSAAISAMAGFHVNDRLFIGYGFDNETTRLAGYNSGSHELFLQFDLFKKEKNVESPRFF